MPGAVGKHRTVPSSRRCSTFCVNARRRSFERKMSSAVIVAANWNRSRIPGPNAGLVRVTQSP